MRLLHRASFFSSLALLGFIILFSSVADFANADQFCKVASRTGPALNVRDGPGLSYSQITVVLNDTEVELSGELETDDRGKLWAVISGPDENGDHITGWVSKAYLSCDGANHGRRHIAISHCWLDEKYDPEIDRTYPSMHAYGMGTGLGSRNTELENATIASSAANEKCLAHARRKGRLDDAHGCCAPVASTSKFGAGCAALAISTPDNNDFGVGGGWTRAQAVQVAMSDCPSDDCEIAESACVTD